MRLSLTDKRDALARVRSLRDQKLFNGTQVNPLKNEFVISLNLTSAGRVTKHWKIIDYLLDHISERKHKLSWGALLGGQKFKMNVNVEKLKLLHEECSKRLGNINETTWLDIAYLCMIQNYFDKDSELSTWANETLKTLEKLSPELSKAKSIL